ncbi:hypothetical protein JCM10213_002270 [Rhodosporidiobolus nylandii]
MDLEALRKAALQTKKRKRTTTQHLTARDDDPEEGEIQDDPPPPPPPVDAQQPVQLAGHLYPSPAAPLQPLLPPAALGAPVPLPPQALHAIKEESKAIIAELLTYGVPPDYLLSIGVSRDILEISFHELNLDLTLPPAAPPAPSHLALPPVAGGAASTFSPLVSPSLSASSLPSSAHPPAPAAADPSLKTLEALKRAELLARKAALSARNQQRAQSLESELENLFSAASASPGPPPAPNPAPDVELPSKKRPKLRATTSSASAATVHSLRESLDETEELVSPLPEDGPFASSSSASTTAASVSQSSTRAFAPASATAPSAPPPRRPVATDFESEPVGKMSAQALALQRAPGAYVAPAGREEVRVIIELSDSEEEAEEEEGEKEEEGGGDVEMASASPALSPTFNKKGSLPPSLPSASAAAEEQRKRSLLLAEEKDRELQRLKERIKAMERRKREGKGAGVAGRKESVEPPVKSAPKTDVGKAKGKGKASEEEIAAMEVDDVQSKEERTVATPVEGEASAAADNSAASAWASSTPVPDPEVFRPYQSSLSRFPLCRASASSDPSSTTSTISSSSSASADATAFLLSSSQLANSLGSAGVASWAARKHAVDPGKRLCKAEASGGKCLDAKCKSVHARDFEVTDEELAEYEALRPPSSSASNIPNGTNGMNDSTSSSTLDSA